MNILVVSTYPPMNCGVGKYAAQQVDGLRKEGHVVDVLSPPEGHGDFPVQLYGRFRPLRLLKYLWAYGDVYIHFTPQFFYESEDRASRFMTSFAFLLVMLLMGRRVSFLIHESSFKLGQQARGALRHRIDRWYWRLAHRIIFHSVRERDAFAEFYRLDPRRKAFEIWPQHKYLKRLCKLSRAGARGALGIEPDATLLLCLGFIQPHKGFDRAIRAFSQVQGDNTRLRVVGSVRLDWDVAHDYARLLHELAQADPRVEVVQGYVPDEEFDTWVVAADYLLLPYNEIWTSAVAARAAVYDRPMIAADTGGLAEQLTEGSALFRSDEELVEILRRIAQERGASSSTVEAGAVEGAEGGADEGRAQVAQCSADERAV